MLPIKSIDNRIVHEYGFVEHVQSQNWILFDSLPKIHGNQVDCKHAWIRISDEVESGQLG